MEKETMVGSVEPVHVPFGHIIGNEKWQGSQLAKEIQGKIKLIFEADLGPVDFHLSKGSCILYVTEADLVAGNGYRKRLVRLRNDKNLQGIVIVEKTHLSEQYFPAVQKFVVLNLGMVLLPVASQIEASHLIIQLVHEQTKDHNRNPFLKKKRHQLSESAVLLTVQQIPGVGKVKALLLMKKFATLQRLCDASIQELEQVVGQTIAQQVHTFLTESK